MFCEHCGKELKDGSKFCTSCGKRIDDSGMTEESGRRSEKSGINRKVLFIILGILLVLAAAVIFLIVKKSETDKKTIHKSYTEEDDDEEEEEVTEEEKKEEEAEETETEKEETEESEEEEAVTPDKKALIDLIREEEENHTSLYAIKDFDGDGIYEVICEPADQSFEAGRFAYDGSVYQSYGSGDENWKFYDMEDELEFYPGRDILAFLENGKELPSMPQWLAAYAQWLESYDLNAVVSFVLIDDDEIPECLVWEGVNLWEENWEDMECFVLSYDGKELKEYCAGYNTDSFTCKERSGRFSTTFGESGAFGWIMAELTDFGFSEEGAAHYAEKEMFGYDICRIASMVVVGDAMELQWYDVDQQELDAYIASYGGDVVIEPYDGVLVNSYADYGKALKGVYAIWLAEKTEDAAYTM